MEQFLNLILPFFLVILLGFTAGRLNWIPAAALPHFIRFVLIFILPAMLFELLAQTPFQQIANIQFFFLYAVGSLSVFILGYLMVRFVHKGSKINSAYFAQGCAMPNSGYLGIPMIAGILGPVAGVAVTICLIVEVLIIAPMTAFVAAISTRSESPSKTQLLPVFKTIMKDVFTNSLVISTIIGISFSYFSAQLPGFATATISILAKGAGPIALFSIGLALSQRSFSDGSAEVWTMTAVRLFAHPFIVWLLMFHLFPQDPMFAMTGVLVAALPMAANAYLLGERGKADVQTISATILISSVISVVSFTLILWFLQ